eukprot:TRINITY_DN2310_c0_g1_i1.p1 TRINITY_DN2310_c0_g1~~TRINITY_DN2310_c0_g1_i1.p1  ORF type:complete len:249 (+),score=84.29 TRINITY_DN2310_c0_g1_i1:36-782(+)
MAPPKFKSLFANKAKKKTTETEEAQTTGDAFISRKYETKISLNKVESKSGEEGMDVLFLQHSKLYRWDEETKSWHERGEGKSKILRSPEGNTYHYLLRRDVTRKIASNHLIVSPMQIKFHPKSEKMLLWTANDTSDGEVKTERYLLRFKEDDFSHSFKNIFEAIVNGNGMELPIVTPVESTTNKAKVVEKSIEKKDTQPTDLSSIEAKIEAQPEPTIEDTQKVEKASEKIEETAEKIETQPEPVVNTE